MNFYALKILEIYFMLFKKVFNFIYLKINKILMLFKIN